MTTGQPFGESGEGGTGVGDPPVYPVEGWHVRETDFDLDSLPQSETIFSLSNGYLGLRGNLDEGAPAFERGTYVNGFYESRPIVYPESAYGFAVDDQAMLNVTDGKMISLTVDGEPFDICTGELVEHNRVLDLRRGFVSREVVWESPGGRRVSVSTRRLVSLVLPHLACIEYEVEALGPEEALPMSIEVTSQLVANESDLRQSDDPREIAAFWGQVLMPVWDHTEGDRIGLGHRVELAGLSVFCLTDHVVECPAGVEAETARDDGSRIDRSYRAELHSGQVLRLRKYLVYCYGDDADAEDIPRRIAEWMDAAVQSTFEDLLDAQVSRLDEFWRECHVDIVGDDSLRQAVRFALFQVFQASALLDGQGIPAKGLTGQGYNGHYFWDMETYVLHVLTYLSPPQALQCLKYRHSTLPRARERAVELSKQGALFPWRTINGEEASAFFPAGTAEYHINGDIAHAVRHYAEITGDDEFLFAEGIEVLAETARFWLSLGFYNPRRGGRFCINEVTGPDEYTALVDNNTFTNLMARSNLAFAADVVDRMRTEGPEALVELAERIGLADDEPAAWRAAAEAMYVHYDAELGVHGQDDSFLDKQPWDFAGTPAEDYPLLLHHHPLDLYRSQVIKQADLVMSLFLHGDQFTDAEKRADFAYYDPITTADSSLSMAVQGDRGRRGGGARQGVGVHPAHRAHRPPQRAAQRPRRHPHRVPGRHLDGPGVRLRWPAQPGRGAALPAPSARRPPGPGLPLPGRRRRARVADERGRRHLHPGAGRQPRHRPRRRARHPPCGSAHPVRLVVRGLGRAGRYARPERPGPLLPSAPGGHVGIQDDDIASVRTATDMVAVVSEHVALKRVGRRWVGLCPFHNEKSGSFSVNAEEKMYYCFGCQASGDVITFVREIEHLDFVGAVEKLAAKAGVTLRYTDEGQSAGRKRRATLLEAVGKAADWYHERLLSSPDAAAARSYLRKRGLTGDEVRAYKVGWAPEAWDDLARALRLPTDVFVDAGLGFLNSRGRPTDAFRGRVMFPILDVSGDVVGFGGRILPGKEGAKYKNSVDSTIYNKSRLLYGLSWAKADVVRADEAIVCEGYTDVIGFAKAGVPRAVATCGTALTEDHVKVLRSFARRLVLAFDADAAGQNAAERVYAWERQYDLDVAVAALPGGVDPAELAQSDPAALATAVAEAKPFLKFRLDRVLGAAALDTPEQRARAAEAAMAVVQEHPSDLVRDQYLMEVAARCRVDDNQLRGRRFDPLPAPDARTRRKRDTSDGQPRNDDEPPPRGTSVRTDRPRRRVAPRETAETEALRLMVWRRDEIAPWLDETLFREPAALVAFHALSTTTTLADAVAAAGADDPVAEELLQRLAVQETEAEAHDVLTRLVDEAATGAMGSLKAEARVAEDPFAVGDAIAWLNLRIMELREPDSNEAALALLLGWLTGRDEEDA